MEEYLYQCPVCRWTPKNDDENGIFDHCPKCLHSIHDYDHEGYQCGGRMVPISVWVRDDQPSEVIQRCYFCGELQTTPLQYQDNPVKLMSVIAEPLAAPPFPLDKMEMMMTMLGGQGDMSGYYNE